MATRLLTNARMVGAKSVEDGAWIEVHDGEVQAVGSGRTGEGLDLGGRLVIPGFVDIHVHGGGGATFDGSEEDARRVVQFHLEHGTTTLLAGLATRPIAELRDSAARLVPLVREGLLAGLFYEGPFLSQARRGAHDPSLLRNPSLSDLRSLLKAGDGEVRLITVAPELPGALELIAAAKAAGVAIAVGHTDSSMEIAALAFGAGASVATHLFNGMRPIHHRDPGPVVAAMLDPRVICELIADGFHLDDSILKLVFQSVGSSRIALVTDAIEAAGIGDGSYGHGDSPVVVKDGLAMLADGSSIAGSTLTMDKALRRVVLNAGISLPEAVAAATSTPARVLGMEGKIGTIAVGSYADIVVLDENLMVTEVFRRGERVSARIQAEPGD